MHKTDATGNVSNLFEDKALPGTPGTLIEKHWLNAVQEELIGLLAAGGVTPVKGTWTQVRDALKNFLLPRTANAAERLTECGYQRVVFRKTGAGGAGSGLTEIWITINAAWNGTAWVKDAQEANSLAIVALGYYAGSGAPSWSGSFGFSRQTANVATFADADWNVSIFNKLTPTFTAAKWIDTGGSTRPLRYWGNPFGEVCMEGEVSNAGGGAPTDPITTLPAGYRPAADMTFASSWISAGVRAFCTIKITSAGVVTTDAGTGAAVSFANVRFAP